MSLESSNCISKSAGDLSSFNKSTFVHSVLMMVFSLTCLPVKPKDNRLLAVSFLSAVFVLGPS